MHHHAVLNAIPPRPVEFDSEFQVNIWAAITTLIKCLGLLISLWVSGFAWVCWFHCFSLVVVFDCWRRRVQLLLCSIFAFFFGCCWVSTEIESVRLDFNLKEIDFYGLDSMIENESNGLSFTFQNRVYYIRDISFLNSFENVLTNKIVWKSVLFFFLKKTSNLYIPKRMNMVVGLCLCVLLVPQVRRKKKSGRWWSYEKERRRTKKK